MQFDWHRCKTFFQYTQVTQSFQVLIQYLFVLLLYVIWPNKEWCLSTTSILTSMLGHMPISSLGLNASLYLYSMSINFSMSFWVKHENSKSTHFSNTFPSVRFLLSSSSFNKRYLSIDYCSSLFKVLVSVLNSSHSNCNGLNS